MVKAHEASKYKIKKNQRIKIPGEREKKERERDPYGAEKEHVLVFKMMSFAGNNELEEKSHQKPQIREDPDVRIILNEDLFTVEQRKDHRDRNGSGIVDGMEKTG